MISDELKECEILPHVEHFSAHLAFVSFFDYPSYFLTLQPAQVHDGCVALLARHFVAPQSVSARQRPQTSESVNRRRHFD